jgi:FMNH2-dependent dimethyl sulfone monooxygenase
MRFGIWTPLPHTIRPEPRMERAIEALKGHGDDQGGDASFQFAVDVLQRGERHGFEVSLIAARQLGPDLEAWTMAAALSGHTTSMELMVAVHPGINTPQMVAKMGASLDRISGGRLSLNVVNGWNVDEFNIFGNGAWLTEPTDRYTRMDEYIQVIKRLWTEDSFDFDGKFYKFQNGNLPLKPRQKPNPPIYAASRSPSGKDTIAKYCDHWFVPDCQDYRRFDDTIALIKPEIANMQERAHRYGRKLGYGLSGHVICAPTLEEAQSRADSFEAYGKLARYNKSAMAALGACLVGTPDMIIERIKTYEQLGIDLLLLHFHPMIEGFDQFVEEILPSVKQVPSTRRSVITRQPSVSAAK